MHVAQLSSTLARIGRARGAVDVLVNNAGIGGATPSSSRPRPNIGRCSRPTTGADPDNTSRAALDARAARGLHRQRHLDRRPHRHAEPIPYSASKHALAAASEALAHEALAHEALAHEVAAFGV